MIKNYRTELILFLFLASLLLYPTSFDFFIYNYFSSFINLDINTIITYQEKGYQVLTNKQVFGPAGVYPLFEVRSNLNLLFLKKFFTLNLTHV